MPLRSPTAFRTLFPFRVHTAVSAIGAIAIRTSASSTSCLSRPLPQTAMTIGADPKHLGARLAITAVLHTWGSAMTHHPHLQMIVPGQAAC